MWPNAYQQIILYVVCSCITINMTYFHCNRLAYLPLCVLNVDSVLVLWHSWGFGDLGPPVEYSSVFTLALTQAWVHEHRPQQEQNSAYWPVPDGKGTYHTGWMEILWKSSLHLCLTRPEYNCRHEVAFFKTAFERHMWLVILKKAGHSLLFFKTRVGASQ